MGSGFLGLDIALRSLLAHQRAIEVVSHNIANVNTPGYSRQEPVFVTEGPYTVPVAPRTVGPGQVGTGVRLEAIRRLNARFLNRNVRLQKQAESYWTVLRDTLQHIEALMPEPSEVGLGNAMDQFWAAWVDLSGDPQSTALRTGVYEQGRRLASLLRSYSEQLTAYQRDLNLQIAEYASDINEIVQEIADLNVQIVRVRSVGDEPNDLYDRRDALLDELSELADITYEEGENGTISVFLGGHYLVMWGEAAEVSTQPSASDPTLFEVAWNDETGQVRVQGGKLAGVIESRQSVIPEIMGYLDDVADALITNVNVAHSAGFGLDNSTGLDFFTGSSASDIEVNAALADPSKIAAASAMDQPGDGSIALQIAQIADQLLMNGGQATIGDFYRSTIGNLGLDAQHAASVAESNETLVGHLEERREQVSGVSLDEETVNLIRYQRAYQASARLISVIDEMLDQLINLGRA